MRAAIAGLCVSLAAGLLVATPARAHDRAGEVAIGLGAHAIMPLADVCERDGDVVNCGGALFAGGDLSGHYYLLDWFALGVRGAGSKDLDGSQSSNGDDRNQWLWRFSAEARLHPPILPSGLWIAGELGGAFLVDSFHDGPSGANDSATQKAFLLGAAAGFDFMLGESLLLGIDARLDLLTFSKNPPRINATTRGTEFGSASWVALGARFTYRF